MTLYLLAAVFALAAGLSAFFAVRIWRQPDRDGGDMAFAALLAQVAAVMAAISAAFIDLAQRGTP